MVVAIRLSRHRLGVAGDTRYLVLKNMGEAEYVADYILGNGNKEDRRWVVCSTRDVQS